MSALADILAKRARLTAAAQAQRSAIAESVAGCRHALAVVDRGIAWGTWLRAHPYILVIGAVGLLALRPKRAFALSARAFTLWRVGRFLFDTIKREPRHPSPDPRVL
jgi:hypothetical protein